jgi:UDP-N-acetylmuramoyl-L-alanyl-D-glutamate--2,6-diaminopimelate ligase
MTLAALLKNVQVLEIQGDDQVEIGQIQFDSRAVRPGDVFVALRGATVDGHQYVGQALQNGAVAVVLQSEVLQSEGVTSSHPLTTALVPDTAEALGQMAANFHGHPSRGLTLVGVTGTNGKTTTVTLLWQLFSRLGYRCGLIGTVENRVGEDVLPSTHTTPDVLRLHALLRQMADAGCQMVFMEVSSHAVHQRRIAGAHFSGAVFSNLSHDHLDYHKTFAAYRDAKKKFFDDLPKSAFALTNADDRNGMVMLQNTAAAQYRYGLKKPADFKAKIIENSLSGLHLDLDGTELHARMIGEFNAYNLVAAYAVAMLLAEKSGAVLPTPAGPASRADILAALSDLRGAEGRFDYQNHPQKPGCIAIVDYAHTPDALEKVLETIQKLKPKNSRVLTVTGAGGDRDKTKRPLMAQVCARLSDQLILTSDNPRTEDPAAILRDMEAGLDDAGSKKTLTIPDREQAIKAAVQMAGPHDVILVAGKGHEKYQDINGTKHPFDDKRVILKYFQS